MHIKILVRWRNKMLGAQMKRKRVVVVKAEREAVSRGEEEFRKPECRNQAQGKGLR